MAGTTSTKFIGFFRLVEACDRPGCPVCHCLIADARQYLESVLYEQVTDPGTRARLGRSWGFCNWHAWMLRETSAPSFGSAIVYEALVRAVIERFERVAEPAAGRRRRRLGWLRRMGGRATGAATLAERYRARPICPGCRLLVESERRYLEMALQFAGDSEFDRAYERSHGLCVPHVMRALEIDDGGAAGPRLVAHTLPKLADLRRDLEAFVGKHDHRNRQPFTEAESVACARALEAMTGAPGLFGKGGG